MLIIADKRIPIEASQKLSEYGDLVEFETRNITYEPVSCHPDIFICQKGKELIVAPNIPALYISIFEDHNINYCLGKNEVGEFHPFSAFYNAVITDSLLIHKTSLTDSVILQKCTNHTYIDVKQAYTRCSLLALKKNTYITSDNCISRKLKQDNNDVLLISSDSIILPGLPYGLFGGTAGIHESTIFFIGSLKYHPEGKKIKEKLNNLEYQIVELYDGPLFDGGGILFLEN